MTTGASTSTPRRTLKAEAAGVDTAPVDGCFSGAVGENFSTPPAATSRYLEHASAHDAVAVCTHGSSGGTNVLASRSGVFTTGGEMAREDVETAARGGQVVAQPADPAVVRQSFDHVRAAGTDVGEEVVREM